MNFLAIPTLKNERACFRLPISIIPLRGLNDTFESARIGIANVGSFERWAAATTTSAMPTSLVSTLVLALRFAFTISHLFFFAGDVRPLAGSVRLATGFFARDALPSAGFPRFDAGFFAR